MTRAPQALLGSVAVAVAVVVPEAPSCSQMLHGRPPVAPRTPPRRSQETPESKSPPKWSQDGLKNRCVDRGRSTQRPRCPLDAPPRPPGRPRDAPRRRPSEQIPFKMAEAPRGSQKLPESPRGSQKLPEAPRSSQRLPELPKASRGSQRLPEDPRAPRGSQRL